MLYYYYSNSEKGVNCKQLIIVGFLLLLQACTLRPTPYVVSEDYEQDFDYLSNSRLRIEYSNNIEILNDSTIFKNDLNRPHDAAREIASRFASNIANEYANDNCVLNDTANAKPKLKVSEEYLIYLDSMTIDSKTTDNYCVIKDCGDASTVTFNVNLYRVKDRQQLIGFKVSGGSSVSAERSTNYNGQPSKTPSDFSQSDIYENVFHAIIKAIEEAQGALSNFKKNETTYN